MHWIDVCGPPGVGKSAICDPLWHPHALKIDNRLPPKSWEDFVREITRLFFLIKDHWSIGAAIRMNRRSLRKISLVSRLDPKFGVYVQTALIQRGLGFGWRLNQLGVDLGELVPYFQLMPAPLGVAALIARPSTIVKRNHERLNHKETAHENRDFMVPLMIKPMEIAVNVLAQRGIPILEIDTEQPVEECRASLVAFADRLARDAPPDGPGCEMETISTSPYWWG